LAQKQLELNIGHTSKDMTNFTSCNIGYIGAETIGVEYWTYK